MKTRESLFNELNDVRQQMMGISPKLSLYQSLKSKEAAILLELGGIYVKSPGMSDQIKRRNGSIKYINKFQKLK